LQFGVTTIPNVPWDELVSRWRAVDALPGIESLWIPDHLFKGWYECWAALGGLAVLSTALAYVLYFRILAAAGATNLLLVTFLIPVTAVLLGAAVLGERLAARDFAGMALIGVGLAVSDGRITRLLRPAK